MISVAVQAAEIAPNENIQSIAQSEYWKRLLHVRKGWVWSEASEADGQDFFLSTNGRHDPLAELLTDLAAFQNPEAPPVGPLKQHPQCAFPERFRYLQEVLGLSIPPQPCLDFVSWKNRFNATSATLVYAAAYFGSPSSMFGHTFLRIDSAPRKNQQQKSDLLDYGISFEANMGPHPGFAYPIKGLLGLYPGTYSQMPYYLKINGYVNMESRDLWEYQLNLSSAQLDHLLNHLWELTSTHFDYYFFNRNCSYQLMTLLEVAEPDWNLKYHFGPSAIPVDTIRAVHEQPNAIRSVHFRSSLLRQLKARLMHMSVAEQDRFYVSKNDISLVTSADSAKTLDALMDWQKIQAMQDSVKLEEADKHIDFRLLQLRAKAENPPVPFSLSVDEIPARPESGHLSSKLSSLAGSEGNIGTAGIELRPAFHDLLDNDQGTLPGSVLNIGRLRASYLTDGSGTARLDEFLFGEVSSLQPMTRLATHMSWFMGGGLIRPMDIGCTSCMSEYFQGGAGLTAGTGRASISVFATGHTDLSNSFTPIFGPNYRAGPGAEILGLINVSDHFKLLASLEHIRYFPGPDQHYLTKAEGAAAFDFSRFEIRTQIDSYASPWADISVYGAAFGIYF